MTESTGVPHPGRRIKAEVIPTGMSVTKAAELIGVGRPALSNLLNGKATLSADMASRLEKAFQYPLKDLMEMQAQYDAAQARQKDAPADTKAYVPPYLAIKANDIERWVTHNIPARSRLAVFLRTLVHSTGRGLTKVDFPGNDDAERPGWDGFAEASEGAPWVPLGRSGWEFGTSEDPKKKADSDFEKSVKACNKKEERAKITFVFVTPRRWDGKKDWVTDKRAKGLWKDVRAYDASDIEQWLEQSLPAQAWFANETNVPADHVRSLDRCWADWANVSTPPLTGTLFSSAIEATKRAIQSRLTKPSEGPIQIAADSTEEALAFLSQLLSEHGGEELASYRDHVLVFDKPGVLPRLAAGAQTFIAVVFTREVERELCLHSKSMHSFVIYPRNASTTTPDIVLEPASNETFNKALEEMGMSRDEVSRLASASGRSLTVLRRQLSSVSAVQRPEWAVDHQAAVSLVPFLFVGAWNSHNEADKLGLSLLANDRPYEELERQCQTLLQLNDAPVWSIGTFRGVISKIDLLYAIAGVITNDDLEHFFSVASLVLGEDDPALDLAEEDRWAASIHGKVREFSTAFREGVSETLVLMAVHGNNLFRKRLGVDTELSAEHLIRDLLPEPLTTRRLEANDRDLPTYAETAPDVFLSILENDLASENPAVFGLLRPVNTGVFGLSPSRTGLLWALEGLSWSPVTLPRAAYILARLAQIEISDNWVNKPTHSLEAVFRAWMPQTAASHETRVEVMKQLAKRYPDVAWKICVAQLSMHHQVGDYSHKPRWRPDGYGYGEPIPTWGPIMRFVHEIVELALSWDQYSREMLCDLVTRLDDFDVGDQSRIWGLVNTWAVEHASDMDKAVLREKIRVTTLSRRAVRRSKKKENTVILSEAAKNAYAALEPADLLNKHAWLFREGWVDESADEIYGDEDIDFQKREERITKLRLEALREVLIQRGYDGVFELAERGRAAWSIGRLITSALLSEVELHEFLSLALQPIIAEKSDIFQRKNLISGALHSIDDDVRREAALKHTTEGLSENDAVILFSLAPFRRSTWILVDALSESAQAKYWSEIVPDSIHYSDAENSEAVQRLLNAKRPRAAFSCVRFQPQKLDTEMLFRLLSDIAQGGNEQADQYQLEQYYIEQAFDHISNNSKLTLEQKAGLEFAYIDALARPWSSRETHGIPNLERYVEMHPEVFVQAITWTYKRKDDAIDPIEFRVASENKQQLAERGYKLLEGIKRIPGHNHRDELEADQLAKWLNTVRNSCSELGRGDIGDICIGSLLSAAPVGADGVWPCEPVRQVLEEIRSENVMRGAQTGLYNARGVHMRGEGGDQERELANQYRKWAEALQLTHPYVSSELLMGMAKSYERDAGREDLDASIRRRLG